RAGRDRRGALPRPRPRPASTGGPESAAARPGRFRRPDADRQRVVDPRPRALPRLQPTRIGDPPAGAAGTVEPHRPRVLHRPPSRRPGRPLLGALRAERGGGAAPVANRPRRRSRPAARELAGGATVGASVARRPPTGAPRPLPDGTGGGRAARVVHRVPH